MAPGFPRRGRLALREVGDGAGGQGPGARSQPAPDGLGELRDGGVVVGPEPVPGAVGALDRQQRGAPAVRRRGDQ
jgi:hypothetical protein